MSHFVDHCPRAFESLIARNAAFLERHKRLRVFQLFTDGTFDDEDKREMFFRCLQVFSRHFQTILFARQAHCADGRYGAVFQRHLGEELGHDEILRQDRGRSEEVWDPVLEGTTAWFISRMMVLDNVEKLAVVHLVLEASGAHMGAVSKAAMGRYGSANYFKLHDEVDDRHVTMALEPLRHQPPETIARVMVVIEQAWQMMDTHAERIATLVLGTEHGALDAPGPAAVAR
jgi:hypothetical protein